jgi:hypothetical protein
MKWPRWRFEERLDPREVVEEDIKVSEAKAEAVEALSESYNQLEEVRKITQEHQPVREQLRRIRERNGLAEGLTRVIREGGR